jgi:prolyl oligopeptidase
LQKPPIAKKVSFSYVMHGETIKDPYQWLDNRDDPKVKNWVEQQNIFVKNNLKDRKYQELVDRVKKLENYTWQSAPYIQAKYYYLQTRGPKDNQAKFIRKNIATGKQDCILDPNKFDKGQTLSGMRLSPDCSLLAYLITQGGSEENIVKIRDVQTKKDIKDELDLSRGGQIVWRPDNSGFYYSMPDTSKTTKAEPYYFQRVYFHKLGTSQTQDVCVFGQGFEKEYSFGYTISPDGNTMAILATKGWKEYQLFIYDCKTTKSIEVLADLIGIKTPIITNSAVYVHTDCDAPNWRVLKINLSEVNNKPSAFEELIAEDKESKLEEVRLTSNVIITEYLHKVSSIGKLFSHDGKYIRKLKIPALSTLSEIIADRDSVEFSYSFNNFLQSRTVYTATDEKDSEQVYMKPQYKLGYDYCVEQKWYKSADGTKIPMFILRQKNMTFDGKNPTALYSYGGYGTVQLPGYYPYWAEFVKDGGIYVVANIRGGGEFGKNWHTGGTGKNKIKSFEDINAAAEYLVEQKYTSTKHLAIIGGSNGGMSVLASMVLRPELFGAVIAKVPLSDMYRFHKFLIASRWTEEKGNPEVEADYKRIKKWSPYHNLKKGVQYPPLLLTTGYNDSRVHPMHAWKMAALMQEFKQAAFMETDFTAGHGKVDKNQSIHDQALTLRFLVETIM